MKISVAMATYNGEPYLAEQLRSLAEQDRPPDQLVVCDDQSSDLTFEILQDFEKKAAFEVIAIRNEMRLGINRNFMRAINTCSGDLIFLSDQDDVWAKEKLRKHEEIYRQDGEEKIKLVFNNADIVDPDLKPIGRTTFDEFGIDDEVFKALGTDRALATLLRAPRITGCTLSFRSALARNLPEVSPMMLHDEWLSVTAALLGRIRPMSEILNYYRQHATQAAGIGDIEGVRIREKSLIRQYWIEHRTNQCSAVLYLIEKLHEKGVDFPYQEYRHYMIGYLSHQWRRVSYPKNLVRRLPLVFTEWLTGNYGRYHDDLRSTLSLDVRPKFFVGQER